MHNFVMGFSGHRARKRFGQHWLRDAAVLDQILTAADLSDQDRVLEVGPGRGVLTERLLASAAAAVHAVELDRDLVAGLLERFGSQPRFSISEGDVLRLPRLLPDGQPASTLVSAAEVCVFHLSEYFFHDARSVQLLMTALNYRKQIILVVLPGQRWGEKRDLLLPDNTTNEHAVSALGRFRA